VIRVHLMYDDTSHPVQFKKQGNRQHVTLILPSGSVKSGLEIEQNGYTFSSNAGNSKKELQIGTEKMMGLPGDIYCTDEFIEVKKNEPNDLEGSITFSFKFSTNVTSRQHGEGREFCWNAELELQNWLPETLSARSDSFILLPRPPAKPPSRVLKLDEVVTDQCPGDLIVCIGELLSDTHVHAELGQAEQHLARLDQLKPSNSVYICRLPVHLAPGTYWIRMCSSATDWAPSKKIDIQVLPSEEAEGASSATEALPRAVSVIKASDDPRDSDQELEDLRDSAQALVRSDSLERVSSAIGLSGPADEKKVAVAMPRATSLGLSRALSDGPTRNISFDISFLEDLQGWGDGTSLGVLVPQEDLASANANEREQLARTKSGEEPDALVTLCMMGDVAAVEALLETHGTNGIHEQRPDGSTPLSYALLNGHDAIAEVLLKHGANPWEGLSSTSVTLSFNSGKVLILSDPNSQM